MAEPTNEHKLLTDLRSGSHAAYGRLVDMYQDKVYGLAYRMVGPADAEDVAQEALIEICNSVGSFQGRSSLSTWVHRVAVNVCLEHRRRRRPEFVPFEDDLLACQPDPGCDPGALALKCEVANKLNEALDSLSDTHRSVVVLHEMQGLTYQECSSVLGCPVGTVKSRLSNAFRKLRELLREYVSEGGAAI